MKSFIKISILLLALNLLHVLYPKGASARQTYVSFQVFYDQLSPYGQWVNYSDYGYVWIPDAGPDFVPYSTDGYWVLTDYGWTWVSDYNWGWAPYHYGRWGYDNFYGWFWIPGNEWGPAWVTWRRANGYYGWAPMGPGVSINASFSRDYNRHSNHWIFVRDRDIERHDINRYYVNRSDRDRIIRNSTVINNTYVDNSRHTTYISGPARNDVEKVTGRRISPAAIQQRDKPGQDMNNGRLQMYRPQVKNNYNNSERKPAPSRITNLKEVQRPSERKAVNQPRNENPPNNNRREQQPNTMIPPQNNNNNREKPSQQQTESPSNNSRREQQPNNIKPPQKDNNTAQPSQPRNENNNRVQLSQPRIVSPPNNTRRKQQPNTVKPPQKENNNKAQTLQPKKESSSGNNRSLQPKKSKPEKN